MALLIKELLNQKIIDKKTASSLEKEVKETDRKEEEVILSRGIVDENRLFELKSRLLAIPLRKDIIPEDVKLDVLALVPEESAKYYKMVPLQEKDKIVEVGMVYPEDLPAQEALKFLARQGGFEYQVFLITPSIFDQITKRYREFKVEVTKALGELEEEVAARKREKKETKELALERLVEEAPISRIVAVLLSHAVEGQASDIHIEPTRKELRIRMRQDGVLKSRLVMPLKIAPAIVSRVKILSGMRIDETRVPQDGRFSTKFGDKDIDFRVSTLPTSMGEKVAIRILDPAAGLKGLADLGLSGPNLAKVQEAIKQPFGMVLATGPTGSGKTTTLYAILQILNKETVNIITIEDPIEYFVDGVNQSQVRPEIGYDFASGLRSILRQDPNVIMVGEIRDSETASLATHAALTGHIVLSTLHTNNAIGVIPRLIDLGVAPYLLPPTLRLAIAQRLVRKLCESCKKEAKPSKDEEALILKELRDIPPEYAKGIDTKNVRLHKAVGCRKCRSTGYSGRIAIFEILPVTDEIAGIIAHKPSENEIWQIAKKQGMITMRQDGVLKVLQGITSLEEVIRATEE